MGVPMTPLITDYLGSSGMHVRGKGGKKWKENTTIKRTHCKVKLIFKNF